MNGRKGVKKLVDTHTKNNYILTNLEKNTFFILCWGFGGESRGFGGMGVGGGGSGWVRELGVGV